MNKYLASLLLVSFIPVVWADVYEAAVVIYGPTSAGIAAAVQVKRMGKPVIVVGPDKHLGGLSAGGLGWTDSGNKVVIGGISREVYQRIRKIYDQPADHVDLRAAFQGRHAHQTDRVRDHQFSARGREIAGGFQRANLIVNGYPCF